MSTKSAAAATRLSEEELETFRALRQEWEAEKTAEAAAKEEEEMQLSVYRNRVPPRPPDPDRVISICGVRVKAVKVRVNHGQ